MIETAVGKSPLIEPVPDNIPDEMKTLQHWINWRYQKASSGKPKKVPYNPNWNLRINHTNPIHWRTFEDATNTIKKGCDGIGFVFSEDDPYCGIDLDNCRNPSTGLIEQWALRIIGNFNSYSEISPSGCGVKIFCKGKMPGSTGRRTRIPKDWGDAGEVEMYDRRRYFALTGWKLLDAPPTVNEAQAAINDLYQKVFTKEAQNPALEVVESNPVGMSPDERKKLDSVMEENEKFRLLWRGDLESYPSQSEADLALCGYLARLYGRDPQTIDRAFRDSGLFRPKWDDRHGDQTYGEMTITTAIEGLAPGTNGKNAEEVAATKRSHRDSQQKTLLALCEGVDFFMAEENEVYGVIPRNGHREVWQVKSEVFKRWLRHKFYQEMGSVPAAESLRTGIETIEARTHMTGKPQGVSVRLAEDDGRIYIDLANDAWEVVEIDRDGWRLIKDSPIRFRRASGMKPLSRPERGGNLDELKGLINVSNEDDFILITSFLLMCFSPRGPYPLLMLEGEQECGKTTLTRLIKTMVDPGKAEILSPPRNEDDFWTIAKNTWLPCFDNLSWINETLSDCLCRQSTGGGYARRTLYTNTEMTAFEVSRPCILNGIDNIAQRADLISRSIIIVLPTIPKDKRIDEQAYEQELQRIAPRVLGSVCDALSCVVKNGLTVKPDELPRLGVFAKTIVAAEEVLPWGRGRFMEAYRRKINESYQTAVGEDIVAMAIRRLICGPKFSWKGTADKLLTDLRNVSDHETLCLRSWPKDPARLGKRLTRLTTMLRSVGIEVIKEPRGTGGTRLITISRMPVAPCPPAVPGVSCPTEADDGKGATVTLLSPDDPLKTQGGGSSDSSDSILLKEEKKDNKEIDEDLSKQDTKIPSEVGNLLSLPSPPSQCNDSGRLASDGNAPVLSSVASPSDTISPEAGDPELQEALRDPHFLEVWQNSSRVREMWQEGRFQVFWRHKNLKDLWPDPLFRANLDDYLGRHRDPFLIAMIHALRRGRSQATPETDISATTEGGNAVLLPPYHAKSTTCGTFAVQ